MTWLLRSESARIMTIALVLIAAKVAFLGYRTSVEPLPWPTGAVRAFGNNLFSTMSNREPNREAREELTAGYYEGLINEGSRLSGLNRLATGNRVPSFRDNSQPDRRETHDFLFYELIPNSDIPDYRDDRARYRLKTNSLGFADREYTVAKPARIRRIAIMGDSITRGQGAPFGATYEALLEQELDARVKARSGGSDGVEILNFAVGSFNITQQMEMAQTRAARFDPDVYVYSLSTLSIYGRWWRHLSLLVNAGIDLKHDYLRKLIAAADVRVNDPVGVFDAKMAGFRLPTIRWALAEMKAHAQRQNAKMLVLLVPTVTTPSGMEESFLGIPEILRDLDIPYVSLLDSFEGVDLQPHRVAENDHHPNAAGHRRLYERLLQRLDGDAALMRTLAGP
jgi:lysophospholipase L1-like esterase